MEPAKTPKPRQREQEADHEQEHEHLKGQNDPRCLKWGEGRAPSRRKESLPCSQASGRGVRIVHHRVGQYPVQRDLYSAFLAAYLDPANPIPSCARYVIPWEGAEARLRAAYERVQQRAREGQSLPRSFGCARAGARLPGSLSEPTQEPVLLLSRGRQEA